MIGRLPSLGSVYIRSIVRSEDNIISNNTISSTTHTLLYMEESGGIVLSGSGVTGTIIINNTITNYGYGIMLERSSNNTLRGNTMIKNRYHFSVSGVNVSDFLNDVDVSNTVDGKPIYYWINKRDIVVPADAGYVAIINSYNITVKGLQLKNNGQGILLVNTTSLQIRNNNITNNKLGIELFYSSDHNITENTIINNYNGIQLFNSSSNALSKNIITKNSYIGLFLIYSSNNTVAGNTITANHYCGIGLLHSYSSTLIGNTITNNEFGIAIEESSSNILSGNRIANNEYGINPVRSSNNSIYTNDIAANEWYGIGLHYSSNNTIAGNNITNNEHGIYLLYNSNNNSIRGNKVTNNNYGIHLLYSSNNSIYHNNFVNNKCQVYIENSENFWDDGYHSGGNYWSDYTGVDLFCGPYQNETGSDGIGDTPYVIDENNIDRYPLMNPVSMLDGDINLDLKVDYKDLFLLAAAYGSTIGEETYNRQCDINYDGKINYKDLFLLAANYGQKYK